MKTLIAGSGGREARLALTDMPILHTGPSFAGVPIGLSDSVARGEILVVNPPESSPGFVSSPTRLVCHPMTYWQIALDWDRFSQTLCRLTQRRLSAAK